MIQKTWMFIFVGYVACQSAVDDRFIFDNGTLRQVNIDDGGNEWLSSTKIDTLLILTNDELPYADVETCWKTTQSTQSKTTTIRFSEVAQSSGINHDHRNTVPAAPFCQFDDIVSSKDNSSSETMKLKGSYCLPELLSSGVASGDYDGDGDIDLLFTGKRNTLYRNQGDGTFTDVTDEAGVGPMMYGNGAGFFDADEDGDLDLYVTTLGGTRHFLYINYGGHFKEEAMLRYADLKATNGRKLGGMTPSFGDYDNDGYLDIHVAEFILHNAGHGKPSRSRLLHNVGKLKPGYFEDTTDFAGVNLDGFSDLKNPNGTFALGSAFTDLNNDGWLDLIVSGYYGQSHVFFNNRNATFTSCISTCWPVNKTGQHSIGLALADYNNDGYLDWFSSGVAGDPIQSGSTLFINNRNGTFSEAAEKASVQHGGFGTGSVFFDFNNDGYLDLVNTNGMLPKSPDFSQNFVYDNMKLFENKRQSSTTESVWQMQEVASEYGMNFFGQGRGLVKADIDNDGDEDVIVATLMGPMKVFRNDGGNTKNWLKVSLKNKCIQNKKKLCDSHSGRVTVMLPSGRKQMQEIGSNSHYLGQSETIAHFGLGNTTNDVNLLIQWPKSGITMNIFNVPANVIIRVVRPESSEQKTFAQLKQCPRLIIKAVTQQPENISVKINPDQTSLALVMGPGVRISSFGSKTFQYVTALSSDPDTLNGFKRTATVSLDFRPAVLNGCSMSSSHVATDYRLYLQNGDINFYRIAEISSTTTFMDTQTIRVQSYSSVNLHAAIRFDGFSNNKNTLMWGASNTPLKRLTYNNYADGVSVPAGACGFAKINQQKCSFPNQYDGVGSNRPSARLISNVLFAQTTSIPSLRRMNDLTMHFGQFFSHDIDLTPEMKVKETEKVQSEVLIKVPVPKGDTYFDPMHTGDKYLTFIRSVFNKCKGDTVSGVWREQLNIISSFIDAGNVYGTTAERNKELRLKRYGKLKQGTDGILPKNINGIPTANHLGRDMSHLYMAGDVRVNVQPGLMAMHSLFVREHNRICEEYMEYHPSAGDEEIFQNARRLVIAEIQSIVFNEYLPSLFGGSKYIPKYTGYKPHVDPRANHLFSAAAFRFGHTQVNSQLFRLDHDFNVSKYGHALLRDCYHAPEKLADEGGLDPLLRGMMYFPAQEMDTHIVDDMRNMLFGTGYRRSHDLAVLNIERGRDHGLPDYKSVRKFLKLREIRDFSDITRNTDVAKKLKQLYKTVDNIDLWVGGLSEDHEEGSEMGPTFRTILMETFLRLRDGDRFWYQNIMSPEEIEKVESITIARLIQANTGFKNVPSYGFFAMRDCDDVKDFQCVRKEPQDVRVLRKENKNLKEIVDVINSDYIDVENERKTSESAKEELISVSIGLGVSAAVLLILSIILLIIVATRKFKSKSQAKDSTGAYTVRERRRQTDSKSKFSVTNTGYTCS